MSNTSDINRRKFMEMGIYTIGGAIATVSGIALAGFAIGPSFKPKRAHWVEVDAGVAPISTGSVRRVVLEYETKDSWVINNARALVYLQRNDSNELIAISAGCTHLGCIVTWDHDSRVFKCPCNDGRYDVEGNVLSGPPPSSLRRHPVKIENGRIYLRTESVPFGGENSEGV